MAKFEQFHNTPYTQGDLVPGNPYKFREYPKMLIKAHECRLMNNKMLTSVEEPRRSLFAGGVAGDDAHNSAKDEAQLFNTRCQRVVRSKEEESQARSEGWSIGHVEAMQFVADREHSISEEAARINHRDKAMSERAQAEAEEFKGANFGHQAEIPAKPIVKDYSDPERSNVAEKKEHWKTRQARERKAAQA